MYAISLLLRLSSTSAMIFIDSGALLREESMEDGKDAWSLFPKVCHSLADIIRRLASLLVCLFRIRNN